MNWLDTRQRLLFVLQNPIPGVQRSQRILIRDLAYSSNSLVREPSGFAIFMTRLSAEYTRGTIDYGTYLRISQYACNLYTGGDVYWQRTQPIRNAVLGLGFGLDPIDGMLDLLIQPIAARHVSPSRTYEDNMLYIIPE